MEQLSNTTTEKAIKRNLVEGVREGSMQCFLYCCVIKGEREGNLWKIGTMEVLSVARISG